MHVVFALVTSKIVLRMPTCLDVRPGIPRNGTCLAGNSPECRTMQHTSTFRGIPGPLGQNVKFALHTYVRNHVIFHLHPVPSKNIEKRLQNSASKKNCEFFFSSMGIPQNCKKIENFFFTFFEKEAI